MYNQCNRHYMKFILILYSL